ncbi:MAG: sulfurtransferase TusA family protein, partial [Lachnospiraceae bacterium]|nr:sulfurtransferase TusA family protein [Lachnospiraceae bacterium]
MLDCKGLACPIPVVKSKKAIGEFTEDGVLTVLVDNEIAV